MNAAAFFITLTLYLPIQTLHLPIQKQAIFSDAKRARSVSQKDLKAKKPPCGPVPFSDISCEEVTTCVTVTTKDDEKGKEKNKDDEPSHKRYKTTYSLKNSALRQGPPPSMIERSALRQGPPPAMIERSALRQGPPHTMIEKRTLHQGPPPAMIERSALRQGPPPAMIEKRTLHQEPPPDMIKKNALRQDTSPTLRPLTSSTIASYAGGTTPKPEIATVGGECKKMAVCRTLKWKEK